MAKASRTAARKRKVVWVRRFAAVLLVLAAVLLGGWLWYHNRPQPSALRKQLFHGVDYSRESRRAPRPLVIHTATVQLGTPGLEFVVTPGNPRSELPLQARTTPQFAREFGVQLAINGDFFGPWYSNSPWDYFPRAGDPVKARGPSANQGVVYTRGSSRWKSATLHLARNGEAHISPTADLAHPWTMISGSPLLLDGALVAGTEIGHETMPEPRSALALDRERKRLFLVVVDGRQPNYSEGVTLPELARLLRELGAYTALNLDGGGSSALMAETRPGHWEALNSPIDNRIPGRVRAVANHLGVRARRLD